jgi:hypothetical protein
MRSEVEIGKGMEEKNEEKKETEINADTWNGKM